MDRTTIILLICLFAAAPAFAPAPLHAEAITYVVPRDFSTIQAAIDEAARLLSQPSNTNSYNVLVEPGTYPGGITLKNSVPLRGRETARTFLNGGTGAVITANGASSVSVRNFTLQNAATGIDVLGNSSVTIENNVFALGSSATAVRIAASPSSSVTNNTFYQNGIAVSRDNESIKISNNIFSNNGSNIVQTSSLLTESNITYNLFNPAPASGTPVGTNVLPDATVTDPDPLFVDAAKTDFHLMSGSPAIDSGDPNLSDPYIISPATTNPSDRGAYGGTNADTIPMPVSGLTATTTATAPYAITFTWSADKNYLVAGYLVYYGHASRTYDGADALDANGLSLPSPVDVGSATTAVLSGLTPTTVTPSAPALNAPRPLNQSLDLSWSAVPGATSYAIHYGIDSTAENTVDAGNTTSYKLTGLTNGQVYKIAISAVAQAIYYCAVTAYDASGRDSTPGEAHESAYSDEQVITVGERRESGLSNEVSGLPEQIVPYPTLPNSGCFIATAAYGSADAPPVRLLRSFRDRFLITTAAGREFVRWYYTVSPALAEAVRSRPLLRPVAQILLAPAVVLAACLVLLPLPVAVTVLAAPPALLLLIRRRKKHGNM